MENFILVEFVVVWCVKYTPLRLPFSISDKLRPKDLRVFGSHSLYLCPVHQRLEIHYNIAGESNAELDENLFVAAHQSIAGTNSPMRHNGFGSTRAEQTAFARTTLLTSSPRTSLRPLST
jgi:hypothetical protein